MKKSLAVWSPRPDARDRVVLSDSVTVYGLPVVSIEALPLNDEQKAWVATADTCIFISHNAVTQLLQQIPIHVLQGKNHIAIGERTAKTLRNQQLSVACVAKPPFTSEALLATESFTQLNSQQIALCCGVGGRAVLQTALTANDKKVKRIASYYRNKAKLPRKVMVEFTSEYRINAVIMSSCDIADAVVMNLSQANIDFRHWTAFAFSERIAEHIRSLGFLQVIVAPASDQQSLNQAIQKWWEIKGNVK